MLKSEREALSSGLGGTLVTFVRVPLFEYDPCKPWRILSNRLLVILSIALATVEPREAHAGVRGVRGISGGFNEQPGAIFSRILVLVPSQA